MRSLTDHEKIEKIRAAITKYADQAKTYVGPGIIEAAFRSATKNATDILDTWSDLQDIPEIQQEGFRSFMQCWLELGLLAGFVSGAMSFEPIVTDGKTVEELFGKVAQDYAASVSTRNFTRMQKQNFLITGVDRNTQEFLRLAYESSLYTGFLCGVEFSSNVLSA
jgi:hypothetical protein